MATSEVQEKPSMTELKDRDLRRNLSESVKLLQPSWYFVYEQSGKLTQGKFDAVVSSVIQILAASLNL